MAPPGAWRHAPDTPSPSRLRWQVLCEVDGCGWFLTNTPNREATIARGREHARRCHRSADEWAFRVQGIRVGAEPRSTHGLMMKGVWYPSHEWEPKPTSRDRSMPCGRCGIYRHLHADMYGYAESTPVAAGLSDPHKETRP